MFTELQQVFVDSISARACAFTRSDTCNHITWFALRLPYRQVFGDFSEKRHIFNSGMTSAKNTRKLEWSTK